MSHIPGPPNRLEIALATVVIRGFIPPGESRPTVRRAAVDERQSLGGVAR